MVNKVIKLDGIWLCSEEGARMEQVPDDPYALVLKDAFMLAADADYPMTQEGVVQIFLDWSEGAFAYVPNRKRFFIYEALEYDHNLNTWGGVWRAEQARLGLYHVLEDFTKELIGGKQALLKFDLESLSEDVRQQIWEMTKRVDKRMDQTASITDENLRKFVKKHGSIEIPFDDPQHSGKLINCQNGVFDLETMTFRSSVREDFMTYVLPVMYNPAANADEIWPFLDKLFCGNEELMEYALGLLGLMLDRTYLPKPILLFYSERGSSGRSTFLRFLGNCLGPFVNNSVNEYASHNHPYFKKGTEFHLTHVLYPPRLKTIMFPIMSDNLTDMGWDEIAYCGDGGQITYCSYDLPKFDDTGTILSVIEANKLPALKPSFRGRIRVIPFEWERKRQDSLTFEEEKDFCTQTIRSMFLNLLIEYYNRYVSGQIYEPHDLMDLDRRCIQGYDQERIIW